MQAVQVQRCPLPREAAAANPAAVVQHCLKAVRAGAEAAASDQDHLTGKLDQDVEVEVAAPHQDLMAAAADKDLVAVAAAWRKACCCAALMMAPRQQHMLGLHLVEHLANNKAKYYMSFGTPQFRQRNLIPDARSTSQQNGDTAVLHCHAMLQLCHICVTPHMPCFVPHASQQDNEFQS